MMAESMMSAPSFASSSSSLTETLENNQLAFISSAYEKLKHDYDILQAKYLNLEETKSTCSNETITRKRAKPSSPTKSIANSNITTHNYYTSLDNIMDIQQQENANGRFTRTVKPFPAHTFKPTLQNKPTINHDDQKNQSNKIKKKIPPPIVAYQLDHKQCTTHFPTLLGSNNFKLTKINKNCSRIQVDTKQDFMLLKDALRKEQTSFHTFTPSDEKPSSIILRHLCSSYDQNDIEKGLNSLNINLSIRNISKLETDYSKRSGKQLDLWLILLDQTSDVTSLIKTNYFLHQRVRFEHRKNKNTLQCHNCQHFGHTANNCNRPYRCIKCTDKHAPGECSLPQKRQQDADLQPTCVNCKLNHAANYKGCNAYQAHIKKSNQSKPKLPERINFQSSPIIANTLKKGVSYAAAITNQPIQLESSPKTTTNNPSIINFLDEECNTHFNTDFNEIYNKTVNFKPTYDKATNKPLALISFILSITPASP